MFSEILHIDLFAILTSIANFLLVLALAFFLNHVFDFLLRFFLKKTKTKLDDKIILALRAPVFWSLFLAGLYMVFAPLIAVPESLVIYRNIFKTAAVGLWVITITKIIQIFVREISAKTHHRNTQSIDTIVPVINNIAILVAAVLIVLSILGIWGIGITPIIASAGIVGAGFAFAAKDTVANFIGGISVFFDKTYKVGDYIIIGENRYRGEVIEIGARSTKIRTRDNIILSVPNAVMVTNAVVNETGFDPKLRIRVPLTVSYKSELGFVEEVLLKVASENKNILRSPKPIVRFRSFEDSGIRLELLCNINQPSNKGTAVHQLIKNIHKIFREQNITIPFPQRDIYIHARQES